MAWLFSSFFVSGGGGGDASETEPDTHAPAAALPGVIPTPRRAEQSLSHQPAVATRPPRCLGDHPPPRRRPGGDASRRQRTQQRQPATRPCHRGGLRRWSSPHSPNRSEVGPHQVRASQTNTPPPMGAPLSARHITRGEAVPPAARICPPIGGSAGRDHAAILPPLPYGYGHAKSHIVALEWCRPEAGCAELPTEEAIVAAAATAASTQALPCGGDRPREGAPVPRSSLPS